MNVALISIVHMQVHFLRQQLMTVKSEVLEDRLAEHVKRLLM